MDFRGPHFLTKVESKGIASQQKALELTHFQFKWIRYPRNTREVVYSAPPGVELDSVGLQKAIDSVHLAGGGTVIVPAGDYLIAPLELRSRVTLHLEPGAHLHGSPHLEDYRRLPADPVASNASEPGGQQVPLKSSVRPLISATDCEDIAITGSGTIDGQSPQWIIPWMNAKPDSWESLQRNRPGDTIRFYRCRNIRIEGISIVRSPSWTLVFDTCTHVQVRAATLRSFEAINSDGIDLVNTSNVTISDCNIWSTDDSICLKNFLLDFTMSDITVTNCVIRSLCNGLKIGTETIGNVENVTMTNCALYNPADDCKGAEGGINLCAMDGGVVRNVNISNIVMRHVDCPFFFLAGHRVARQKPFRETRSGRMERIFISNILADGARHTSWIVGQPDQPIRDVTLHNINIRKTRDFYDAPVTRPVPELPEDYPSPCRFGRRHVGDDLPAYGLYLRHVNRIGVRDFQVDCVQRDAREFIVQENCERVTLRECESNLNDGETG